MVLNKKKSSDFDSAANVLVKNLPKEMAQNQLYEVCKAFGTIVSCKLEVNKDGSSRMFGYIQYANKEQATSAIEKLNGSTQMGKEIQAIPHSKKNDREDAGDHFTNLFVKNIPTTFTEQQLTDLFKPYGEITSVKVKGDGSDVGFVMFKEHTAAKNAIEALNCKMEIEGRAIFVSKHISKSENQSSSTVPPISQQMKETFKSNIYVRYLPKTVTEKEFRDVMGRAGKIISMKLKDWEQTAGSEKFVNFKIGYVCYSDVKEAQRCIQLFDTTHEFGYGSRPLHVDFWQSKYDLRNENEERNINQVKKFINYIQ